MKQKWLFFLEIPLVFYDQLDVVISALAIGSSTAFLNPTCTFAHSWFHKLLDVFQKAYLIKTVIQNIERSLQPQ